MSTRIVHIALWMALTPLFTAAQPPKALSIKQLDGAMSAEPRPTVIKLYTSWCTYCTMQEHELQKHPELAQLLENEFHYVAMDAETKEDIIFNGETYRFISNGASGGTHQLAYLLGSQRGTLGYPAWVVLNRQYRVIARHQGFLTAAQLRQLLADKRQR